MNRKEKKRSRKRSSTRQLMNIKGITAYSLDTPRGELVFFIIKPTNISVLSDDNIRARISALMDVIKGMPELELLCLNSRENFESHKAYLRRRADEEANPALYKLLKEDLLRLDQTQTQMATSREFSIILRLRDGPETDASSYIARVEKSVRDQGFTVQCASEQDYMRLLGVYFEQNVTTERFENFEGERWIVDAE